MERTINGKELRKVLEDLQTPFEENKFKTDPYGNKYLPLEILKEKLNDVVGIFNYDFEISSPVITVIGTRPHVSLKGSLTIRDDMGNIVTSKHAPGGAPIVVSNTTQEAVAFKNDQETAASDAFKRCCKLLGMAGSQLKEMNHSGNRNAKSDFPTSEPQMLYRITLKEKFQTIGKDGYCAMVSVEGEENQFKLIVWKNAQEKIEEKIPMVDFVKKYGPGKTFSVYGTKSVFSQKSGKKEEQLIMDAPYYRERQEE